MNEWDKKICTASPGELRMVHIDPRDSCPTAWSDYRNAAEVRAALGKMMAAQREVMSVFNDKGERVSVCM